MSQELGGVLLEVHLLTCLETITRVTHLLVEAEVLHLQVEKEETKNTFKIF